MKKNLGVVPAVYPMPVLMVAAYDETGKVNVMNAAWGMICNMDRIALFIDEDHKTTQNILKTKAFTVSIADREQSLPAGSICQRNMTAMNLPGYRKQRKRSEKTARC